MKIDIKAKDDDGNVIFEGELNRKEVGFLIQYAVNDLMHAGVAFNLQEPDDEDNPQLRFDFASAGGLN